MPITGSNAWGSFSAYDGLGDEFPNYAVPEGTAVPAPSGALVAPQSPSGAITMNTGRSESATETFLSTFGETVEQQGSVVINAPNSFAGVLPGNAVQTFKWE
jgi:hypothetical protein